MTASLFSLMTVALVMAAFRLPAYMMFRGMRSPFGMRRPIMVVRVPMSGSMPVFNTSLLSNLSSVVSPQIPLSFPTPNFLPIPGQAGTPVQFQRAQLLPNPIVQQQQQPNPSQTFVRPVFISTPHPYVNRELKITSKSVNNRPYFQHIRKHENWLTTTVRPYDDQFHQVFRPSNKYKKISKEYIPRKTTTVSYDELNSNQDSGNEENRYAMMYPMPRNYQNHRMDSQTSTTTSTNKPSTSDRTSTLTTSVPITTTQRTRAVTKLWVKPSLKSNQTTGSSNHSLLYYHSLKQTHPNPNSIIRPTSKIMKHKFRSNRTRPKITTTTELTTEMTPSPIENYKPVKARVHPSHKDSSNNFNNRLMFDDTKNLYYFVTLKTI